MFNFICVFQKHRYCFSFDRGRGGGGGREGERGERERERGEREGEREWKNTVKKSNRQFFSRREWKGGTGNIEF
jgi:hypothetical protein